MEKTLRSEFETLREVLKVKEMTERGIYVSYYDDVGDLHDSGYHSDLDLNNTKDFEVFREIVEEQYLEKYDNLNKPFVTFEKQGVTNRKSDCRVNSRNGVYGIRTYCTRR